MRCIICYNNPTLEFNIKTQSRRGLILNNTTNGLKKKLSNHLSIAKKLEEKVSNPLRSKKLEIQPIKKNLFYLELNFFIVLL